MFQENSIETCILSRVRQTLDTSYTSTGCAVGHLIHGPNFLKYHSKVTQKVPSSVVQQPSQLWNSTLLETVLGKSKQVSVMRTADMGTKASYNFTGKAEYQGQS